MTVCGECSFYLKRGECPKAVYKKAEMNRVACNYNDKACETFKPKYFIYITKSPTFIKKFDQTLLPHLRFNGPDYVPKLDRIRLTGQIQRIYGLISDGVWRTLGEIERVTGDPQASISAQLRHLRKERFGGYIIQKRRRGLRTLGLWEYRLER